MSYLSDAGLWAAINFLVLAFLIVRFGGKPIAGVFRARQAEIARGVEAAERALAEAL